MFPGKEAEKEIQQRDHLYQACQDMVKALNVCLNSLPGAPAPVTKRPPMIRATTSFVAGDTYGEKPIAVSSADVFNEFKSDMRATLTKLEPIIASKELIKPDSFEYLRQLLATGSEQIDRTVRKLEGLGQKNTGNKRGGNDSLA